MNTQMNRQMNIRKMLITDYDGVYQLWTNTPGMGLNNLDDSKSGIDKYLKRNSNTCFVAVSDDTIIGVILSGHDGRRGFIYHTSVAVAERYKGIATNLLRFAMEALKEEGINKVALVAFSKNEIGNAFWEKQGFAVRSDLVYRNKNINEMIRMDT